MFRNRLAIVALLLAGLVALKQFSPRTPPVQPAATVALPTPQAVATPADLSLVLKELVVTHPSKQISRDFHDLVDKGRIFLNFQSLGDNTNTLAGVMWVRTTTHGEILTMWIDGMQLVDTRKAKELKQLVIFHEYQHIKQQLERRYPRELAMNVVRPEGLTAKDMRQHLDAELEAYEEEAKLAISLGWQQHLTEVCNAYQQNGRHGLKSWLCLAYRTNPLYRHLGSELERYRNEP